MLLQNLLLKSITRNAYSFKCNWKFKRCLAHKSFNVRLSCWYGIWSSKIRAMQIIDELEKDVRGIYAGGIGYITPGGDMDTCIVLRTGIISKEKLYVQAGGGIVYDSSRT